MRTHSACVHAHRSTTAARPSLSRSCSCGYRVSSAATTRCKAFSNAASSRSTSAGGTPSWAPIKTRVASSPGSPRKRPTNFASGTSRPAIVSRCQRRASSTVGTSLRRALSRASRRILVRFLRNCGLSASQSATNELAYQPLSWPGCRSGLALYRVFTGQRGLGVGEPGDRRLEVRVRLAVCSDAAEGFLEIGFHCGRARFEILADRFIDHSVQRHLPDLPEESQAFLEMRVQPVGRRLAQALRSLGPGATVLPGYGVSNFHSEMIS